MTEKLAELFQAMIGQIIINDSLQKFAELFQAILAQRIISDREACRT